MRITRNHRHPCNYFWSQKSCNPVFRTMIVFSPSFILSHSKLTPSSGKKGAKTGSAYSWETAVTSRGWPYVPRDHTKFWLPINQRRQKAGSQTMKSLEFKRKVTMGNSVSFVGYSSMVQAAPMRAMWQPRAQLESTLHGVVTGSVHSE